MDHLLQQAPGLPSAGCRSGPWPCRLRDKPLLLAEKWPPATRSASADLTRPVMFTFRFRRASADLPRHDGGRGNPNQRESLRGRSPLIISGGSGGCSPLSARRALYFRGQGSWKQNPGYKDLDPGYKGMGTPPQQKEIRKHEGGGYTDTVPQMSPGYRASRGSKSDLLAHL